MALGEASVRIVPDTSGFAARVKKDVDDALNGVDKAVEDTTDNIKEEFKDAGKSAEKAAKGIGNEFKKLGNIIGGAVLTRSVVNFAKTAINQASDLSESINAIQVSFGDLSDELFAFGETAATAVGLSKAEFNTFAVRFSGFTKVLADESRSAADVTIELTKRIADFASVNNLALEEAALVFGSTLAGETEPIRRFGKDMSAASVEAFALATGMIKSKDEMTAAIKVQATYAKLMADTNEVTGDFVNTSDGFANRQRILTANFKNMQAEIGQALIPAMEGLLAIIDPIVTGISKIPDELRNLIAIVGLSTAATVGLTKSLVGMAQTAGMSTKFIGNLRGAMGLLNVAMIAFAIYQQDQANNAATLAKVINTVTTASDKQLDSMKSNIQIMMDLQDISPEEMFRKIAEESLGAASRLLEAGQAQEIFGISTAAGEAILNEMIAAQQQANEDAAEAARIMEESAAATNGANAELIDYVKGLGFVVSESGEVEASQENMARAVGLAQDRYDTAVEALEDYVAALGEVFDATRKSIDTGFSLVDAELEATEAIAEARKALKDKSLSAAELDAIMRDTSKTVLSAADAEVAHAETLAAMRGETLSTAETQQIYIDSLEAFRDTLDPSSPLAQYINGFITTLGTVPTDIPVELTAEVDAAETELNIFKDAAKEIGGQITLGILEALAPLSPEFQKMLDKMRAALGQLKDEAGNPIIFNVKVVTTSSGQKYTTTPYGATPIPTVKTTAGLPTGFNFAFADGGIFDSPQVGLFAEAGAEAIIPLTRPARALELMRDSGLLGLAQQATGAGQNFDIKVVSAEPMRTAKDVVREFQALEYRMGPL